jgi:glucose/arabinose dehydrogenase
MTFLVITLVAAACTNDDTEPGSAPTTRAPTGAASEPSTPTSTPSTATSTTLPGPVVPAAFEDVATGFDVPWGLVFLPDGSALLSERDTARILSVSADGGVTEVGQVEGVQPGGEGGLLGLAVAPDSPEAVYAYFTAAEDNRVVRMPYQGGALGAAEVVIDGIPKAGNHNGGRLAFGLDGKLNVSTGVGSRPERALDLE